MKKATSLGLFSPHYWGILILSICLIACETTQQEAREPKSAQSTDFEEAEEVSVKVAEGFDLQLWAPGPLLSNAVSITFDPQGIAYVSETQRRKSSDLDIRQHRDWMTEELGLTSLEETEAFHLAKLDPSLSEQNTWQEDFNEDGQHDWKDLMVQSEYIRRIWDSDGDGRADTSILFADGFNGMLTGVAAGILHHDGEIFLTAAPDVWRIQDNNGDGTADGRTSISHGYGIHIGYAGHDMSGLTIGVDGKLYWSIGDIGVNVTDANGKNWAYPHQGAVMRANPDGSEFEVFAHGLRNPQELAFDQYGNLISVDNDGDHRGEHERIVHILEGSDSGWRTYWQFGKYNQPHEAYKVWTDERLHVPHFPGQAAYLLPPISEAKDGPAGFAYNPGTALGKKWTGYFFSSHFKGSAARSQLQAFQLEPKGASFAVGEELQVILGIASTGISFGPDGALYIADWKDSYDKKPEGRVWRLDIPQSDQHDLRKETQKLLQEGFAKRSEEELSQLLAHADMRIRLEAQFELVERNKAAILLSAATSASQQLARLHGIWGIGQLARKDASQLQPIVSLLGDSDAQVRAQVAKVIGEATYTEASQEILLLLSDPNPMVVYRATETAGKLNIESAFDPLIEMLVSVGENDPHLRHAITYALSKLATEDQLAELANHPSLHARIGAVVALRRMRSGKISDFLNDSEPLVLLEAARAINDDASIPDALPALASSLTQAGLADPAFVRRSINANLRLGDSESAKRLLAFAQDQRKDADMRADALWALGSWSKPPVLDRVDGQYRELPARNAQDAASILAPELDAFFSQAAIISTTAAEVAGRLQIKDVENALFALVQQSNKAPELRVAALGSLAEMKSSLAKEAIEFSLKERELSLRTAAQSLIGEADFPVSEQVALLNTALENGSGAEQQKAFTSLGKIKDPEASTLLRAWLQRLADGKVQPAAQLDLILAAEKDESEATKALLQKYQASFDENDPLAGFREAVYGGNARRGLRLAYLNESAQCFRCHQVDGQGGVVGPDLTGIASKLTTEELLAALIEPSARIAPGYGTVSVELKNGDRSTGILLSEDQRSLVLRNGSGEEMTISKADVQKRTNAPSSMPSMKQLLTKPEIRDVMAFLMSLEEGKELTFQ